MDPDIDDVKDAVARNYLNDEWKPTDKRIVRELIRALDQMRCVYDDDKEEKFLKWYDKKYKDIDIEFNPSDKDFWEHFYEF